MPNPSLQPTKNRIFLESQFCIGWWEGRTDTIGTFTFQWYHVIKYSCTNCITHHSFSIFNLHARFISWSMPNTDNWWGGRIASSFQNISMLWSNDSSQNRVSTDQYHLTVWRAQSLTHGADAVFSDLRWSSVISFQPIASSYLSQERNFRTNRDRLKKLVVTSKGPRKWETFHKKGNDVTKKRKPDF